jgi:hypothetical protein
MIYSPTYETGQTSAPMIGFEKDEIVHVYGAQGDQLRVRSKPGQVGCEFTSA